MFKLSKTTDYGIVLLAQLASDAPDVLAPDPRTAPSTQGRTQGRTQSRTALADRTPPASAPPAPNARDLAESADLPVPMVSKILKALAREGILVSQRGSKGGYQLARPPEDLTVADMIRVLEGPVALTDCAIGPSLCEHESLCAVREPWQVISRVVERALADVTLADLVRRGAGMRTSSLASAVLQIDRTPEAGARS